VEKDLRTIPGLGSMASTASLIRPEIAVRPDFARAADLGVTSAAIGETLRIATLGDYDVACPSSTCRSARCPSWCWLRGCAQDLAVLERLAVPGTRGPVMLGQVATLELTGGPAVIDRYDRSRNINFEIELSGLPLGDVAAPCRSCRRSSNLPPACGGRDRRRRGDGRAVRQLRPGHADRRAVHLHRAGAAVQGLPAPGHHPGALPLSLGGAFVGCCWPHKSFSMPSLIGLIMLMGMPPRTPSCWSSTPSSRGATTA
jgi:multidrug efflux pump subunit AcrB